MRKEIFEEIFGEDFTITNYKVSTMPELEKVLHEQSVYLSNKIYITDYESGHVNPIELPKNSTINEICMFTFICELSSNGYLDLRYSLNDYYKLLNQRLKFKINTKDKLELLQNELSILEEGFNKNFYNNILTPDNYFNELRSRNFFQELWNRYKNRNIELYKYFVENRDKRSYDHDILLDNIQEDGGFEELTLILQKFTILKLKISLLKDQKALLKTPVIENKYPSIFVDSYSMNLFNYIIENEERKIGRAFVTKYFNLFKDEKRIKRNAKISNFLRYLKTTHQLDFDKLDNRTTYTEEERVHLSNLETELKNNSQPK